MQGLSFNSFHEDVLQDKLVQRLESLEGDSLFISTLTQMMVHFMEKNQELSQAQLDDIHKQAVHLKHQLRRGADFPYIIQEMRQYVRAHSKYDTPLQDFLSSVYEALPTPPTVQQAADVYTEIVMAPVTIVGQVVNQAVGGATSAFVEAVQNKVQDVTLYTFAEQRAMAYIGLGLTAAGIIYSVS
mgnify:CR=1 FL=1